VETRHVTEVYPLKDLTRVPCTPPFVAGIVNVRGRIVPVFDFRRFFGLPEQGLPDLHRIVIIQGDDMELGLLADVTLGVRSIPMEDVQAPLPTLTRIGSQYLSGMTGDHLIILDASRILADQQLVVHEEVEN
jgi:purine-binding chemotaxis protein CheW